MKQTKAQETALQLLSKGNFAEDNNGGVGGLKTGVNTRTLSNLKQLGLIQCEHIYLYGVVSKDFRIVNS